MFSLKKNSRSDVPFAFETKGGKKKINGSLEKM